MYKPRQALRRAAVISPLVLFVLISIALAQQIASSTNPVAVGASGKIVTLSLLLPNGREIIVSQLDGEMLRTGPKGGETLGITPAVLDNDAVKLYFFRVTKITKKNTVIGEKITNIGSVDIDNALPQASPVAFIAGIRLLSVTRGIQESRIRIESLPRCPCCLTCDNVETCGSGVVVPDCGSCMCSNHYAKILVLRSFKTTFMDEDDKLDTRETSSKGLWANVRSFGWLKSIFTKISGSGKNENDTNDFPKEVRSIGEHTIALALILISIWLIHWLLNHLLGEETKLFDWIKLQYIFDLADVLVIASYLQSVARKLWGK